VWYLLLLILAAVSFAGQSAKSDKQQPSDSEEEVYDLGPGITSPRIIKQVNPEYSESSRGVRVNGAVLLALVVTSKGWPKDERVIRGIDEELDRAAVEALKQWRFAPARKNDKPVAVHVIIEINFHSM